MSSPTSKKIKTLLRFFPANTDCYVVLNKRGNLKKQRAYQVVNLCDLFSHWKFLEDEWYVHCKYKCECKYVCRYFNHLARKIWYGIIGTFTDIYLVLQKYKAFEKWTYFPVSVLNLKQQDHELLSGNKGNIWCIWAAIAFILNYLASSSRGFGWGFWIFGSFFISHIGLKVGW